MVVASFTQRGVEVGPAGGHISVGAMPRSYQVTSVGPSHPVPALLLEANPKAADAKRARHQVIRNQPPHLGTCHDDTPPIRQLHPDTETQSCPEKRGTGSLCVPLPSVWAQLAWKPSAPESVSVRRAPPDPRWSTAPVRRDRRRYRASSCAGSCRSVS